MKSHKNIQPDRMAKIVEMLNKSNYVTVEEICDLINVSPATIRRDLRILNEKGIIDRFHGGVTIKRKISVPFSDREKENIKEKNKIALEAVKLIKNNSSIILDAGTTVMQLARQLDKTVNRNLTIITTAINIAQLLLRKAEFKIILSGGLISVESNSLVSTLSVEAFGKLKANIAFIGCEAVSPNLEIMYSDFEIIQVKQAILKSACYKVMIADSSKFGKTSLSSLGEIDLFDMIITDSKIQKKYADEVKKREIELIIAE